MKQPVVSIVTVDADDQPRLMKAFEQCRPDVRVNAFNEGDDLLDYLTGIGGSRESAPDLVVIHADLPSETCFDLIRKIKSNYAIKHYPLIILTGSYPENEVKKCYELGVNTVIAKPHSFDELVRVLKKVCDYWFGTIRM